MSKTTIQKLNVTPQVHEDMIFSIYSRWCQSVVTNDKQFQMVLANSSISKWFMVEYAKCEAEFHKLTNPYVGSSTVSTADLRKCHEQCTHQMFNIRPMALLERIKGTGSMTFRSNGMTVFNTLNQN
jgi:hypothetical protein